MSATASLPTECAEPVEAAPRFTSHFVCRLSGLPVGAVLALGDVALARISEALLDADDVIERDRERVSETLHACIHGIDDKRTRNSLLDLRRTLFNRRVPRASVLELGRATLPAEAEALVHCTVEALIRRDELLTELAACHSRATDDARARFKRSLHDVDFQSGVALSSDSLFRNIQRYCAEDAKRDNARLQQIERGLLRYFSRMATKATPFGTFCSVVGAELRHSFDDGLPLVHISGDLRKTSVVRLNKRLYAQLWKHLLARPAVRMCLVVEVNPTLSVEDTRLVFLAVAAGRETFQRVPRSEVLDVVVGSLGGARQPTLASLVHALAHDARTDASIEDAQTFLEQLLNIGLLRLRAVVPEQEADWVKPLATFLEGVADSAATRCLDFVRSLDEMRQSYETATPGERSRLLRAMTDAIASEWAALGLGAPTGGLPIFEDATADAVAVVQDTPGLRDMFERLAQFISITFPLGGTRADMATIRHFHRTHYAGDEGRAVPLLRFYEDFYRQHFKAHTQTTQRIRAGQRTPAYDVRNPLGVPLIHAADRTGRRLTDEVKALWDAAPEAAQLDLSSSFLADILADIGTPTSDVERSVSVFAQIFRDDDGETKIVMRNASYHCGYGKYFSRFLYLLPAEWQASAFADNASLRGGLLAEICGDADFNANLHPALLPWEISYPTGQHSGSSQQILSAELAVSPDPQDENALMLTHARTGERVWPVDLGFLNPLQRPPLYQLLCRFQPSAYHSLSLPGGIGTASTAPQQSLDAVVRRPRICFENVVVLARETWSIPHTQFPFSAPGESDHDYFVRVARWRRRYEIPSQVYASLTPHAPVRSGSPAAQSSSVQLPGEAAASAPLDGGASRLGGDAAPPASPVQVKSPPIKQERASRDFRKPQFIDFTSPLLVQLFARLPGPHQRFTLHLEECLPRMDQLPCHEGDGYATEMVVQLRITTGADRGVS